MTQIKIPKAIAQYTNGTTLLSVDAENLLDALTSITQTFNLGTAVLKEDGAIQPYISIVLGDRLLDKATLAKPQLVSVANANLQIKTAFAGG